MTTQDRREFLLKLAKTAAYSAPVIYTLAAPVDLVGQGQSSQHKAHPAPVSDQGQTSPQSNPAPWNRPPPGTPPPTTPH